MSDDGTAGAMPVLEALLVALLVLSAILFVSNVQRPVMGSEAGGVELGDLAAQALGLLSSHTFTVGGDRLETEDWVNRTLEGDAAVQDAVSGYLDRVLPPGARHAILLSNGAGTLRLAPQVDPGLPRSAQAAEVPFLPRWNAFRSASTPTVNATWAAPGQELGSLHVALSGFASTAACLKAPTGSATGPGGVPWADLWQDGSNRVPQGAPYGVWAGYTDAGCTSGATYGRVALASGTITDHPVYGIRLVVWFGT